MNAAKQAVCVVGHMETKHGTVDVPQKDGKPAKRCRIYKTITCDDHVNIAKAVYGNFFNGKFATPHHIWVGPDGKELFRRGGTLGAADFIKDCEKATALVPGPKATKGEYDAARATIAEGADHETKGAVKKAIEAYQKVAKGKVERLRSLGEEKLTALNAAGGAAVDEAVARAATEEKEARAALKRIADEYKPLECAKKASEALKALDQKK